MEKHTTIAVDLSKTVFEIAVSDQPGRGRAWARRRTASRYASDDSRASLRHRVSMIG